MLVRESVLAVYVGWSWWFLLVVSKRVCTDCLCRTELVVFVSC